jgi:hypothetical protein
MLNSKLANTGTVLGATVQGNSWINLISFLLLFIESNKILLGIYVICVIDFTMIKNAIVHTTCIGLKVFCVFAYVCYCVWVSVYYYCCTLIF